MADTKPEAGVEAAETQAPAAAPIFGASSTFGAGTGFGGFTGLAAKAEGAGEPGAADGGDDADDGAAPEEEECAAEFKPVVQLEEVEVSTGEEEEEALFDAKCKLYRYDADNGEWKERGIGQARLLQHKESERIRFLMRQEKTLKIRANHVVMPGTKVSEHSGQEKAMVWSCVDFADEVQKPSLFCIRFASAERAAQFRAAYEDAAAANEATLGALPPAEAKEEEEDETEELAAKVESAVKVEDGDEA